MERTATGKMDNAEESGPELQRLRQRVEQLQAENQRLSGRDSGNDGGASAQPVRREQALYLPRERRCPKFSGSTTTGSLTVEEWVEEAQRCISSRFMSESEKALFLYDHLEGEARNEIKYRPPTVREDPLAVIKVLKEVYGCSRSYVFWQQRFFDRKQRENESLFEFSHALMELIDRVKLSKADAISNPDLVLRDQFCENVCDPMLRRELKKLVRTDNELTLLAVRTEAIRWVEEGQANRDRSHRAPGKTNEVHVAAQCASTAAQSTEFTDLKEIVLKQQAQLDMLVRQLGQPSNTSQAPQPYKGGRYKRTPDGQPICIRCGKPGHIARYCRSAPAPHSNRPAMPSPLIDPPSQSSVPDRSATQPENC